MHVADPLKVNQMKPLISTLTTIQFISEQYYGRWNIGYSWQYIIGVYSLDNINVYKMSNFLIIFLKCNKSNVNVYHNINYNTIYFKLILFNMGYGIQLMIDDRSVFIESLSIPITMLLSFAHDLNYNYSLNYWQIPLNFELYTHLYVIYVSDT